MSRVDDSFAAGGSEPPQRLRRSHWQLEPRFPPPGPLRLIIMIDSESDGPEPPGRSVRILADEFKFKFTFKLSHAIGFAAGSLAVQVGTVTARRRVPPRTAVGRLGLRASDSESARTRTHTEVTPSHWQACQSS